MECSKKEEDKYNTLSIGMHHNSQLELESTCIPEILRYHRANK